MNRERLQMVRNRIASEPPERLAMQDWTVTHNCGTAHCIGGWALKVSGMDDGGNPQADAKEWLGLTYDQSEELFFAWDGRRRDGKRTAISELTQADALAALDSLIHADSDDALPVWPEPRNA